MKGTLVNIFHHENFGIIPKLNLTFDFYVFLVFFLEIGDFYFCFLKLKIVVAKQASSSTFQFGFDFDFDFDYIH